MTKPSPRRIVAGLALLAFAGATAGFAFRPAPPEALGAAVPEGATFVYEADNLSALLESPVRCEIEKAFGPGVDLERMAQTNRWFRRVAPGRIILARIPATMPQSSDTWLAICELGIRAPFLRWRLEFLRSETVRLLGRHHAWPVWLVRRPESAARPAIGVSVTDSAFLICLSEAPSNILLALDAYDRPPDQRKDSK